MQLVWDTSDQESLGLLGFDMSGFPAGKCVKGVRLYYTDYYQYSSVVPLYVTVHKILRSWSEATETWDTFFSGDFPYDSNAIGTLEFEQKGRYLIEFIQGGDELIEIVQSWVDNPGSVYGLLLKSRDQTAGHWVQATNNWLSPYLEIEYADNCESVCGDEAHPYPYGDINNDCKVNFVDVAILGNNWAISSNTEPADPCQFVMVSTKSAEDTSINNDAPTINYGQNWELDLITDGGQVKYSWVLIKFDLPTIPTGREVAMARFKVYDYYGSGRGYDEPVEVREVYSDWDELAVTWDNFGNAAGGVEGIDYSASPIGTVYSLMFYGSANQWLETELDKDVVRKWYMEPATNRGILLKRTTNNEEWLTYAGREYEDFLPTLEVYHTDQVICGYPYQTGDLDHNCSIDMNDLRIITEDWLLDNSPVQ